MLKEAQAHFLKKIASAKIITSPYPHLYVPDIFPENYFKQLLKFLPPKKAYIGVLNAEHYTMECKNLVGINGKRNHIWLDEYIETIKDQKRNKNFWISLSSWLSGESIIKELNNIFVAPYSPIVKNGKKVVLRLVWEEKAIYVSPHMDKFNKPVTIVFYLKGDSISKTTKGTTLYGALPKKGSKGKTIIFAPNSALISIRTPKSFHGVEAHKLEDDRKTLHLYLQSS